MAKEIGAKCVGTDTTALGKFGDKKRTASRFQVYELDVVLKNGEKKRLQLNGVERISTPIELTPLDEAKYPFLKSLELAQPKVEAPVEGELDILLGLDYYYEFLMGNELRSGSGLAFVPSSLGYLVTGYLEQDTEFPPGRKDNQMICLNQKAPEYDLERFWRLEDVGIVDKPGLGGDEIAMDVFNKTVKREKGGRYSVKWPYKEGQPELPDNYEIAKKRLVHLLKKVQPDEKVLQLYDQTITDQRKNGIIEEAPEEPEGLVTYLPHRCVNTPGKTTKLRIVFDASVKKTKETPSLNECRYRVPVLLNDLCGLVLRFRLKAIGNVSDVEKAFLQVGLQQDDRDVTGFLWLKDPAGSTDERKPDDLPIRTGNVWYQCKPISTCGNHHPSHEAKRVSDGRRDHEEHLRGQRHLNAGLSRRCRSILPRSEGNIPISADGLTGMVYELPSLTGCSAGTRSLKKFYDIGAWSKVEYS